MKKNDFSDMLKREMDAMRVDPGLHRRTMEAARKKEEPIVMKKMSAALVCALLIVAVSAVALAAARMGMLDFAGRYQNAQVPGEDVSGYIQNDAAVLENEYVTANVRELYYDGRRVRTVIDVTPKGNAMLAAFDADPMLAMASLTGEPVPEDAKDLPTIRDYYDEHGFEQYIVVDAGVVNEDMTTGSADRVYNAGDGSITLYVDSEFGTNQASREVDLVMTLRVNEACAEGGELIRMQTPLALTAVTDTETYVSTEPADFPAVGVRVDRLTVVKTPMELNYTIEYTVTDREAYAATQGGLFFEFIDPDADESLPVYERRLKDGMSGGSGAWPVDAEDPEQATKFVQCGTLGVGELRESYLLGAYDCFEKTRFDTAEIKMKEADE